MWKLVLYMFGFIYGNAQMLATNHGENGCVTDGGYTWCEPLSRCIRAWETPCIGPVQNHEPEIPTDCISWFDGCNRCITRDGHKVGCTRMMCVTTQPPRCLSYSPQALLRDDVCFRFCEDNSESHIDKRSACPSGTTCTGNGVGYDSCHERAWRCRGSIH